MAVKSYIDTGDKRIPTPTYNSYRAMRSRCLRETDCKYERYGGRGIKICKRWLKGFKYFVEDMGERPDGHTLDRIDNDGDYTPDNCQWSDIFSQNRKKSDTVLDHSLAKVLRTAHKEGARVCDLAREYGLNRETCRLAAIGSTWREAS